MFISVIDLQYIEHATHIGYIKSNMLNVMNNQHKHRCKVEVIIMNYEDN